MKVIIAPDSFKGTLSAVQVCEIMAKAVKSVDVSADIIQIPVADGGEGTVEAFGAEKIYVDVTGPDHKKIRPYYGVLNNTVIIEMAACSGLPLTELKNPELTTTYGVGELILHALDGGYREFVLGLGGSATNDAGTGMAAALGVEFFDLNGESFIPVGGTLINIFNIDMSAIDPRIKESRFTAMCDIDNPLYGERGAAYIFAPQKGADIDMVKRLDNALIHFSNIVKGDLNINVSQLSGGGAAGGMGAGVYAFLNSQLKSGIDVVLDTVGFDNNLNDINCVISGEGKFDDQSIHGKVVSGIANRVKDKNIPFIIIAGAVDDSVDLTDTGITAVFSIQRTPLPFSESVLRSEKDLFNTVKNMINILYKLY
jgi:glycerate kinase